MQNTVREVAVAPPGKLTVMLGDTVRVTLQFDYRGEAIQGQIHVAFGKKGLTFDEDSGKWKDVPISLGPDSDWQTYTVTADVYMGGSPGTDLDLYAKIMSVPGPDIYTPFYIDILDVLGAPEFQNFAVTNYDIV